MKDVDVLVVGGGIVGTTIALELRRRRPDLQIRLLDKEGATGLHASGRNSGVLHAGFYYGEDSLKARFCRDGNAELRAFCEREGLPVDPCGKLVVASTEAEVEGVRELARRGLANGVDVRVISEAEARQIEPRVRTVEIALWSPSTAAADPKAVIAAMTERCRTEGIEVCLGERFQSVDGARVSTSKRVFEAAYVINCAGLYADRVARTFGFAEGVALLPFKGLYLVGDARARPLATHIYPVPDLELPFLGAHFTRTASGGLKIGPTALPVLSREHYGGLEGLRLSEGVDIVGLQLGLLFGGQIPFTRLALREMRRMVKRRLVEEAALLVDGLDPRAWRWGAAGIRAQLLDLKTRSLIMDFKVEGDARSFHVLNAVSPAWTCSLPFARFVCDRIAEAGGPG